MAIYQRRHQAKDGSWVISPHWSYRFWFRGQKIDVNTRQTKKKVATDQEAAHRTKLNNRLSGLRDQAAIPTLKEFETEFFEHVESKTAKSYRGKFAALLSFRPLADAHLDQIDEKLIDSFKRFRLDQVAVRGRKVANGGRPGGASKRVKAEAKRVKPATVNRSLAVLRVALGKAHEWKYVDRIPVIKKLAGEHERDFVLDRAREREYLNACEGRGPLQGVAKLILETGLRVGEALSLEWRDVSFEPKPGWEFGHLKIRGGKTENAKREVFLTPDAAALLRSLPRVDQFVFSNGGHQSYSVSYLSRLQEQVREDLQSRWVDLDLSDFCLHSLRHTALTRLAEAGMEMKALQKHAGHSTPVVTAKYIHPSSESMEPAIRRFIAANEKRSEEENSGCKVNIGENAAVGEMAATC